MVEWNIREPAGQQGAAGMWDSHIRLVPILNTIERSDKNRLGGG